MVRKPKSKPTGEKSSKEALPSSEAEPGWKHMYDSDDAGPIAKRTRGATGLRTGKTESKKPGENSREEGELKTANRRVSNGRSSKKAKGSPTKGSTDSSRKRDVKLPSNLLEKGVIYFFFRGRVTGEEGPSPPHSVDEIMRSYMILRPIPKDFSLNSSSAADADGGAPPPRLLALPKKVLPLSGRERFIAFVEKAGPETTFEKLRDEFLSGSEHETKTRGTRHTPAATPLAEGVYAITTTGRESHLAYIITRPEEFGEVQKQMGLRKRGSFIVSTKNPEQKGPPIARFKEKPDYPKEIMDEFRSLRWLPSQPKHFDYPRSQFLLIGESSGLEKAVNPAKEDRQGDENREEPLEEMEKMEDEDTQRMEHLGDDDSAAIFADLQASAEGYPKLQTEF